MELHNLLNPYETKVIELLYIDGCVAVIAHGLAGFDVSKTRLRHYWKFFQIYSLYLFLEIELPMRGNRRDAVTLLSRFCAITKMEKL